MNARLSEGDLSQKRLEVRRRLLSEAVESLNDSFVALDRYVTARGPGPMDSDDQECDRLARTIRLWVGNLEQLENRLAKEDA